MSKSAVVFGITGQDGSFLSELLLEKSYKVIGVGRRSSTINTSNLAQAGVLANPQFSLIEGDLCDPSSINQIMSQYRPDECYNLAAQSHVGTSFSQPVYTFEANAKGPLLILEAIRHYSPETRFYQASTSEMFGSNYNQGFPIIYNEVGAAQLAYVTKTENKGPHTDLNKYQDETTALSPNSPYAIAKTAAHHIVRMYRDAYGVHASAGILFNHESERRGENFVTRKITKWIANNQRGHTGTYSKDFGSQWYVEIKRDFSPLKLGNIDAVRDWGYAKDYVEAMWLMLQQDKPDDYIIGTGEAHSVRDFLEVAFKCCELNWEDFVEIDPELYRPSEVPYLRCDWSKAREKLGWKPKTNFIELVKKMINHDLYQKN